MLLVHEIPFENHHCSKLFPNEKKSVGYSEILFKMGNHKIRYIHTWNVSFLLKTYINTLGFIFCCCRPFSPGPYVVLQCLFALTIPIFHIIGSNFSFSTVEHKLKDVSKAVWMQKFPYCFILSSAFCCLTHLLLATDLQNIQPYLYRKISFFLYSYFINLLNI